MLSKCFQRCQPVLFTEVEVYLLYRGNKYFSELGSGAQEERKSEPDEAESNFLGIPVVWPEMRSLAACP